MARLRPLTLRAAILHLWAICVRPAHPLPFRELPRPCHAAALHSAPRRLPRRPLTSLVPRRRPLDPLTHLLSLPGTATLFFLSATRPMSECVRPCQTTP